MQDKGVQLASFIVKNIPFDCLLNNSFLEAVKTRQKTFCLRWKWRLERQIQKIYRLGHKSRPAAWDIFLRPRLCFELECPDCGHIFKIDYYAGAFDENNQTACPKCRKLHLLAAREVLTVFEKQVREESDKIKKDDETAKQRLGEIIAHAALLLEPVAMVFVVKFWEGSIGHHILNAANIIAGLTELFNNDYLLLSFASSPSPANSYLIEQWSRLMLITPSASQAFDLLYSLSGHYDYNPAIPLTTKGLFVFPLEAEKKNISRLSSPYSLPMHARHLFDMHQDFRESSYWIAPKCPYLPKDIKLFKFFDYERQRASDWLAKHGGGGGVCHFLRTGQSLQCKTRNTPRGCYA